MDEWVNHETLRRFGHVMRINKDDFVKCMRVGLKHGVSGRPPVNQVNNVDEY